MDSAARLLSAGISGLTATLFNDDDRVGGRSFNRQRSNSESLGLTVSPSSISVWLVLTIISASTVTAAPPLTPATTLEHILNVDTLHWAILGVIITFAGRAAAAAAGFLGAPCTMAAAAGDTLFDFIRTVSVTTTVTSTASTTADTVLIKSPVLAFNDPQPLRSPFSRARSTQSGRS
ncbi:hypothetical protein B0H11DRAFT_2261374 [Mycena galericulata]|nr:hypothetical protein B0H11DRAFT_2261374 [Mycena galericulata]